MVYMIEKKYINQDMNIELTSYIDNKQNFWFRGKDVAEILGYSKTRDALSKHVDGVDKQLIRWRPRVVDGNNNQLWGRETRPQQNDTRGKYYTFINESGFYFLVLSSKLESAKKFKHWVTSQVLPSIRKYGQYKLFDSPGIK